MIDIDLSLGAICDIKIVATTGLAKNWKVSGVFPIVEYLR